MVSFADLETLLQEQNKDEKYCVLLHDYPDPDAVSGGVFFKGLLTGMGFSNVSVVFGGGMDDQNREFFSKLGLYDNTRGHIDDVFMWNYDVSRQDFPHLFPQYFDKFIYVDHNGGASSWARNGKVPEERLLAVVDHHNCQEPPKSPHTDCREIGAVSSILAEYLVEGADKYFDGKTLEKLYPLMNLGIHIDTNYLREGATDKDIEMLKSFASKVDYRLVSSFNRFKRKGDWMDAYGRAYTTRERAYQGANMASVGRIKNRRVRGAIPVAANDLLKEDKIHTIYLFGHDDQYVDVAMRTEVNGFDYNKIISTFPGAVGGGRNGAGRMQIPTLYFSNGNAQSIEDVERAVKTKLKEHLEYAFNPKSF